jgi:hypothetical protein
MLDPKQTIRDLLRLSRLPISLPSIPLSALPTAAASCCTPAPPPQLDAGYTFPSAHRFPLPPPRPSGRRRGPPPGAGPRRPSCRASSNVPSGILVPLLRVPHCLDAPAVGDGPRRRSSSGRPWRTSSTAPRRRPHRIIIVSSRSRLLCPSKSRIFIILLMVLPCTHR